MADPILIEEKNWIGLSLGTYYHVYIPQEDKQFFFPDLESAKKHAQSYQELYSVPITIKLKEKKKNGS